MPAARTAPPPRRPKSADDTERARAIRASRKHLSDLKRAHGRPPADVPLVSRAIPRRIDGEPVASWCTSPARLCAELAG